MVPSSSQVEDILSKCSIFHLTDDLDDCIGYFSDFPFLTQSAVNLFFIIVLPSLSDCKTLMDHGVFSLESNDAPESAIQPSENKSSQLKFQCICSPLDTSPSDTSTVSSTSLVVEDVRIVSNWLVHDLESVPSLKLHEFQPPKESVGVILHLNVSMTSCMQRSYHTTDANIDTPMSMEPTSVRLTIKPIVTQQNYLDRLPTLHTSLFSRPYSSSASDYTNNRTCAPFTQVPSLQLSIHVKIVPAFFVTIDEAAKPGYGSGKTLLSVKISHSNLHSRAVTITQATAMTDHSQLATDNVSSSRNRLLFSFFQDKGEDTSFGKKSIVNMSQQVQTSILKTTGISFPFVLNPQEAVSIILDIQALDYVKDRRFHCPLRVSGYVQPKVAHKQPPPVQTHYADIPISSFVLVSWSTSSVVATNADALRVDLRVSESTCIAGEHIDLHLIINNSSSSSKNLMLFLDGNSGVKRKEESLVCETHIYEAEAKGKDLSFTGTIGLLPIVTNLVIGELKERSSILIQLQFSALKHGVWPVPQIYLIDRQNGALYLCGHTLQVLCM